MAFPTVLYGPASEAYNTYAAISPPPGDNGAGGAIAYRHRLPLGKQLVVADERKFRFAASGSGTLVVGNVLTAGVATASSQDLTAAAGAIADRLITLTTAASTLVNVFAEGFANISVTPSVHEAYQIASHATFTSGAGDIVNLAPGNGLRVALTTSSRVDLTDNIHSRVIQSPATTVGSCPVGVAVTAATTLQGCWVQTRGPAGVLNSGTSIAGNVVGTGLGAAGAAGPIAALATQPIIGWCIFFDATSNTIFLTLDG